MKIEVGDTVELNNGEVHEVDKMFGDDPDYVNVYGYGPFLIDEGIRYHQDGRFANRDCGHILSVKRIISRASDDTQSSQEGEPKLWCDMTDEEKANVPADVLNDPTNPLRIPWGQWSGAAKGALLLAENEGKEIEYSFLCEEPWSYIPSPSFSPSHAYRIKPEPVRETVTLMIDDGSMGGPRAIGTIDLTNGEPDYSSIKMEKNDD